MNATFIVVIVFEELDKRAIANLKKELIGIVLKYPGVMPGLSEMLTEFFLCK